MQTTRRRGPGTRTTAGWSQGLSVRVGGPGTVAHAGIVLPRLLADRTDLTEGLAAVVARAGFVPLRDRGRALADATAALAACATCLSDIEAMTARVEIFGPTGGASDSTMLPVLNELAARLNADGLPGRRLARAIAGARAKAWAWIVARHGQLPAVRVAGADLTRPSVDDGRVDGGGSDRPVLVVRLDATLIEADSDKDGAAGAYKDGAAGAYKGGYGFHPLTAFCTNVGDALAVVSVDGAGGSHAVIDHLTRLNTALTHGRRGRRVEYSIGWPRRSADPGPDRPAPRNRLGGGVDRRRPA